MNAFLIQTMARSFAQMIIDTAAPRLMRAIVCAALIVSVSEAAAQLRTRDTSANAIFHGCKALAEGQTTNAQLYALGNFCAGIVIGLASVGQRLSLPEWQSCAPATSAVGAGRCRRGQISLTGMIEFARCRSDLLSAG